MKDIKRYDHETLRVSNRAIVFSAIRREGECSRFDLSKKTGISPATVGAIVEDLLAEGLLREIRVGASTGGRRPVLVDLRPEGRQVMCGSLTVRGAEFALVDLAGRIVDRRSREAAVNGNAEAEALIRSLVRELLEGSGLGPESLIGSAIDVPGMVRSSDGMVLHSPPLRLFSLDLAAILRELCGKPAAVYKDTDAHLLAEHGRGLAQGARNAVYVWVKEGVGMSYLHDGELLVLPRGGFELGHTAWIRGGSLCHCGNPGCIGMELSESHAVSLYRQETGKAMERGYAGLCAASLAGEEEASRVLRAEAEVLGAVLANVVNLLNPELILIGGPLSAAPPAIRDRLRAVTEERSLPPFKAAARIEFSALGSDDVLSAIGEDQFRKLLFPMP